MTGGHQPKTVIFGAGVLSGPSAFGSAEVVFAGIERRATHHPHLVNTIKFLAAIIGLVQDRAGRCCA